MTWEIAGRWGQLPLPLPKVADDGNDMPCVVAPGEAALVVAAYDHAARLAETLWDELDRAGLGLDVIRIVPSLTQDLRPVVRVQLTPDGARRAGWLFGDHDDWPDDGTEVA